jgi:hypothetical protein
VDPTQLTTATKPVDYANVEMVHYLNAAPLKRWIP